MLAIVVIFKPKDREERDLWFSLVDLERVVSDSKCCQDFALEEGSQNMHVFYDTESMNEVLHDIQRVWNRIGYDGEKFDEDHEYVKHVVRTVREYVGKGYTPAFTIYDLRPEKLGTVALNIRSDAIH